MSMLAREIAQFCEDVGIGVFTTDNPAERSIFVGDVPEEPNEYLLIVQVPSPPPHQYIDTEYPIFDFWYRSPHSDIAYAKLETVFEALHRKHHYQLGNWWIELSRALGNTTDADRDLNGGKLFRLSVQFICRNLNHIS